MFPANIVTALRSRKDGKGLVSGRIQGRREGAGKERTGTDFDGRHTAVGSH